LANRRISRTKNFASYVNALNQDVSTLKNLDAGGSISARSISGDSLADTVTLFGNSIQSNNYAPGAAGWKIDGSGVAEFEDVYVRGDINAETGTIGFWNISPVDATRYIGPKKIFGTFLESADVGINDNDKEDGVYVSLFKSYFEDTLPIINARRVSNVATITVPGHTYEPGDYVQVRVNEDSTFNAYPFAALILETTAETFTYSNPGANFPAPDAVTGIIPSTQVTGTAQYYQDDVAGLFVRDYAKVKFDYGYFSSDGIKFAAGETVNILRNPSFELAPLGGSSGSWDISTYVTNSDIYSEAVRDFSSMYRAWNFAALSSYGAQYTWRQSPPVPSTDYMLGVIDSAGADRFRLFDDSVDRTIYYHADVFFHEAVQEIEIDTETPPVITNTAITITTIGYSVGITSATSNTTVATYTMDTPGTAPSIGDKVTITDMEPSNLNKTNATVSASTGNTFTVTGTGFTTANSTVGGFVVRSGLRIGDVVHTGSLDIIGYDIEDVATNYATAPTGERYFTVTAVPTAASFSLANLWGSTPVTGDPIILDPDYGDGVYTVFRPMRGSVVSSVTIPAEDFEKTTTSTTISITTGTKTLTTPYTGSYLVNHRVTITDPETFEYVEGVISAVTANTSIQVKVDNIDYAIDPIVNGVFSILPDVYDGTTSTSNLAIATGSKTFTTSFTGSYFVGFRVKASSDADPDNYMEGIITSISSNTNIVVLVDTIGGSGTFNDWTFEHISGTYLDITLVFDGRHDFVAGDELYLDFNTPSDDGFEYTDSYTGVGEFTVTTYVNSTTIEVSPWNFNPDTAVSAATPISFTNSSGFVRPAAAYAVSSGSYQYSHDKLALEFSNGEIKYVKDILTPAGASRWNSEKQPSVAAYEVIYGLLTSATGLKRFPTVPLEISSTKLIDAYKELDPDGWAAQSNIGLRVPVGILNTFGLEPVLAPLGGEWSTFVSTVLDNIGLTTDREFFFGGDNSQASSWAVVLEAPNTYSTGSADLWIDLSVADETSSLDHTSSIGFKSTTSDTLISSAGITAQDSRYSSRGLLVFDNSDIGGWITAPIKSPSFGRTYFENNTQFGSLSDYSVITFSSGEHLARGPLSNYKYAGSGASSYTNDTVTGTEMIAYKQTVGLIDGGLVDNKVASVGVWVDGNDTAYATTVADYTEFRSVDGTKRTLTAGYVSSTTGTLRKKRVVDLVDSDGFKAVSDPDSAAHVLYRYTGSNSTTTSATPNGGTVPLAGYFRTGASGMCLINYGARTDHSSAGGSTGISMRVRLGVNSAGTPVTNGAIQSLTVPETESSGDAARNDSASTVFFGRPHTTYYAEFLIYAAVAGTATALSRHFAITPIV
jgi:hypothetical protein